MNYQILGGSIALFPLQSRNLRALCILVYFLLVPAILHCQEKRNGNQIEKNGVLNKKRTAVLNYINDKGMFDGVEGFEYGAVVNGKKTGLWEVRDEEDNLIGQRIYLNDTMQVEIQYKNGRIFSIVRTSILDSTNKERDYVTYGKIKEVVSFKKGKIRSHKKY